MAIKIPNILNVEYPMPRTIYRNDILTIVEQKPQLRSIKLHNRIYRLAFPYIQFMFCNGTALRLSFSSTPAKLNDFVYLPLLPNIRDFDVCLDLNHDMDLVGKIEHFWNTAFDDTEWINGVYALGHNPLENYSKWEEFSLSHELGEVLNVMNLEKYGTDKTYLAAITANLISSLDEFDDEVKYSSVAKYPESIKSMRNPSEDIQFAAVKCHPNTIRHIQSPSKGVQLYAVQRSGFAIEYIKNPSEDIQLAAIESNPMCLSHIPNPSEEIQFAAVSHFFTDCPANLAVLFRHIKNPTKKIQLYVVERYSKCIQYIKNPTEKVQLAAVEQDPDNIQFISKPTTKVRKAAAKAKKERK